VEILTSLVIALALALDAFAVAVASGITLPEVDLRRTIRLSWHFGFFQSMMTCLGWLAGLSIRSLIEAIDHWIAFGLLLFIAVKMIVEGIKGSDTQEFGTDPTRGGTMVMLSVATSIDALAVGLSLSMLSIGIWTPIVLIGVVAALMTALGLYLGKVIGSSTMLGPWAQGAGGVVLIAIGIKILYEHGVFNF